MAAPTLALFADKSISALKNSFPFLGGFATGFGVDPSGNLQYFAEGDSIKYNKYGNGTAAAYNSSTNNFDTASGHQVTNGSVTLNDRGLYGESYSMAELMKIDPDETAAAAATAMSAYIFGKVGALITATNFTNTVYTVSDNTTFDRGDLVALNEKAVTAKWGKKVCLLNTRLYSNLGLDTVLANAGAAGTAQIVNTGVIPNVAGFNSIALWNGMPANSTEKIAGAITDGQGIAFVSALETPNFAKNIEWADAIDPDSGLAIRVTRHQVTATQKWVYNWQMLFGCAVADATRLTIIKDTTT